MKVTTEVYAVIRRSDGREWVEVESMSLSEAWTRTHAERQARLLPTWHACNPVARIAVFVCTEI